MPSAKAIAKYVLDNNVSSNDLDLVLSKYNAIALLPVIIKYIRNLYQERYPIATIESPFDLDKEAITLIKNKNNIENYKFIINKKLLGGYTVSKDYKINDNSLLWIINKLFI